MDAALLFGIVERIRSDIYIYIYVCMCVRVEREGQKEKKAS